MAGPQGAAVADMLSQRLLEAAKVVEEQVRIKNQVFLPYFVVNE